MKQVIRYYSILVVIGFIANILTATVGFAQNVKAFDEMLMSKDVVQGLFGDQISDQSESADLTRNIAPSDPKIITTTNGDVYMFSGDGASAKMSKKQDGSTEITYSLDGTNLKVKNTDTGEEFSYRYELEGAQVTLYRLDPATNEEYLVNTQNFNNLGQLTTSVSQNLVVYSYDEDGQVTKSVDQWGNKTEYKDDRPDKIINYDDDGNEVLIGTYVYGEDGLLDEYQDNYTNTVTIFNDDGVTVNYTKYADTVDTQGNIVTGAKTKEYVYEEGLLVEIMDLTNISVTKVEDGYNTGVYSIEDVVDEETGEVIVDASGQPVTEEILTSSYNYNGAGEVESITNYGEEGNITGWTEFDANGQISGAYNQEGVKVQEYHYNMYGFLDYTVALGGTSTLTDQQVQTTITLMDDRGRPKEVWQFGDGNNMVKIQEYEYRADGILAATYSLGIVRGEDESNEETYGKPLDANGNLATSQSDYVYYKTSKTEFDKKGRPTAVYSYCYKRNTDENSEHFGELIIDPNTGAPIADTDEDGVILEKQQSYTYSKGFLTKTTSYGFNNRVTGTTIFDKYGRPEESKNGQGTVTQEYEYGSDGFLDKTINFGEDGVETGYTLYDEKAKPTDVFNQKGSLVQRYVYDENGLMVMSLNLSGENGINEMLVSSLSDQELIEAMCSDEFDAEIIAAAGSLDNQALMSAMWDNMDSNPDLAKKICLKVIQLFSDEAKGGDQNLINDVGTAYHMLGQFLEAEGNQEGAIAAYKIQGSEFTGAMAVGAGGDSESVTAWSIDRLSQMNGGEGVDTPVVTGYTLFGGDSKPIASYQCYDNGENGVQVSKVQDFIYSYETTEKQLVGQDPQTGKNIYVDIAVTRFSNSVRKTISYGDNGVQSGYTEFDDFGRQEVSYNEEGQVSQKYTYSSEGFLSLTKSYGKDGTCTGSTIFDKYSRPVAAFNFRGSPSAIPDELIAALEDGLTQEFIEDPDNAQWLPYLKGLTQTFEYNAETGFMEASQSWGEAVEIGTNQISSFSRALNGGEAYYDKKYDYDSNGVIDTADLALFDEAFEGAAELVNAYGSSTDDANYVESLDTNLDGRIDNSDVNEFSRNFTKKTKYTPTFTGTTSYDKYGKAVEVTNAEGSVVSRYSYNERGFMERSDSIGLATDDQGNLLYDDDGNTIEITTGYTTFNEISKPVETYSVYNDGSGEQSALVQQYVYDDDGFLERTLNFGNIEDDPASDNFGNPTPTGYTLFDRYGRQDESYNEADVKISEYNYSSQGFLESTGNYGIDSAYLGKTVFDKTGRPSESYNTNGSLTQKFNFNEDTGFMESSTSYGDLDDAGQPTLTQSTYYDGYGKALRSENELGIVSTTFEYDSKGFMVKSNSLAFVEDATADGRITITNTNNEQLTGYYVVTGYTEYDNYSRPEATYQGYWADEDTGEQTFSKVQEFTYDQGFLISTQSFGRNGVETGTTTFDKYGRQDVSKNEFGEITTKYVYSNRGFLAQTSNYTLGGALSGKTIFNSAGRPDEAYNQNNKLVQTFQYNSRTGALDTSTAFGYEDDGTQVTSQITTYDAFGKASKVYNTVPDVNDVDQDGNTQEYVKGYVVSIYSYDASGFMDKSYSFGEPNTEENLAEGEEYRGPCTGFTVFNDKGRPEAAYSVHSVQVGDEQVNTAQSFYDINPGDTGVALQQEFIYNKELAGSTDADAVASYLDGPKTQNTGFVTMTARFGDNSNFVEFTTMDRYGRQDATYNEYSEMTTDYHYNSYGSLNYTNNYGYEGRTGKTYFNGLGRPVEAVNERGITVQTFQYSNTGFLQSTQSLGAPDDDGNQEVMQTTFYNSEGKQSYSANAEGYTVSSFVYNDRGFLIRSNNLGFDITRTDDPQTPDQDERYAVIGYTEMNAETGRPISSYSVYNEHASKTADFIYSSAAIADDAAAENYANMTSAEREAANDTGFVLGTISYVVNSTTSTADTQTATAVGSEVLYNGYSVNDQYGRQQNSYNKEGSLVSVNNYKNGFITSTDNYSTNADGRQVKSGTLLYGSNGRPTDALNYKGEKVSEYVYSPQGFLAQTVSFSSGLDADGQTTVQVMTGYSNYDIYGKATQSYQLFETGDQGPVPDYDENAPAGYQFESGGDRNYDVDIVNGRITNIETINGAGLVSENVYSDFGALTSTVNYGRDGKDGDITSTVIMDSYSKPVNVLNSKNESVQKYYYNDYGFLDFTVSEYKSRHTDEHGEVIDDGYSETKETSVTFYNERGQQTESYLIDDTFDVNNARNTVGALQSEFSYNNQGFLYKTTNYSDSTRTGYTINDASGRQIETYSVDDYNNPSGKYWYNDNGFLLRISSLNNS